MKQYLKEVLDNLLSLPFGIAIVFLALFSAVYYDYIEVAFFVLIGVVMAWSLLKKK